MKRLITTMGLLLIVSLGLAACSGPAGTAQPVATSQTAATTGPQAANTATPNTIQADVPMLDNAQSLQVSLNGTYIAYEAKSTIGEATTFYQVQLEANGWERVNKNDSGFGDSITLLRSKPDQKISVTLQSISGSDNIRVLIALSPK